MNNSQEKAPEGKDWRELFAEKFPMEVYEFGDAKHYCFKRDPFSSVSIQGELTSFISQLLIEAERKGRNAGLNAGLNALKKSVDEFQGYCEDLEYYLSDMIDDAHSLTSSEK